jgi:hypothetical protein
LAWRLQWSSIHYANVCKYFEIHYMVNKIAWMLLGM